jgi:predicted transposase/invertase (TIGR01784 family)
MKAEGIEAGRQEGMREGIQEGMRESQKQFISRSLCRGLSLEDIAYLVDLSVEEVRQIVAKIQIDLER